MNGSILKQIVVKEWYLFRWLIAGSILAGLAALALCTVSRTMFTVGGVSFMVAVVVLGVVLPSFSILEEKKSKTLLFVMSLPLSPMQYARAKLIATGTAFLVPWLILGAAAYVTIAATAIPDGMIPFVATLMTYFLLYHVVFVCVALITSSQVLVTAVIILGNVGISFFMFLVGTLFAGQTEGPVAVWNATAFVVLALEFAVIALSIALMFHSQSRKKDYI